MAQSDPVGDFLVMITNAALRRHEKIVAPHSKFKEGVARVLKEEGYITDLKVMPHETLGDKKRSLHVYLKYGPDEEPLITRIARVSRPGRRVFRGMDEIGKVMDGLGISILSTSKGILSDKAARRQKLGGEVICRIW